MRQQGSNQPGHVYLIHMRTKLSHCQHYVGWTSDLAGRMGAHRSGKGARLMTVLKELGIEWKLVLILPGTKTLERQLKKRKNAPKLCPVCRGEITYAKVKEPA